MTTFADLQLAAPLLRALKAAEHETPTPIQTQAIPSIIEGRDILGIAQTGTGKTGAFALPVLHHLFIDRSRAIPKGCRVLVLSPTRELASQIAESFKLYSRFMRLSIATVFGGVSYAPQIRSMSRGVDVLIATPGRLTDHLESGHIDLSATNVFVLDEADQMLDLGFLKPIKDVAAQLAEPHQALLFSATMPKEIASLADAFLTDPVKVSITPESTTVERIAQRVIHVDNGKKTAALADVLAVPSLERALVFTRTKRGADRVTKQLTALDFTVAAIHGDKSQGQRERALKQFRSSKIQVLVATDIAARGIDVDGVSHVVNFDLPEVPEAYVHRIGRTGRAGATGEAVSFCTADDYDLLHAIEKATRQTLPSEDRRADQSEPIPTRPEDQPRSGKPRSRGRGGPRRGQRAGGPSGRTQGRASGNPQRQSKFDPTAEKPTAAQKRSRRSSVASSSARIVDADRPSKSRRSSEHRTSGTEGQQPRNARQTEAGSKPKLRTGEDSGQPRRRPSKKSRTAQSSPVKAKGENSRAARKKRRASTAAS